MASSFLIGAPASGGGKTTFTLGLLAAIRAAGGPGVAPFKCGPDYIDTQYHRLASGRNSVNLDLFMSSPAHVRGLFARYGSEINIVEGAMGLFDGYDAMEGSPAQVALTLGIPVVMIVDASSAAYSLAPLLFGFSRFNPRLRIAAVVFNRVASPRHEAMVRRAAADAGIECVGVIRRDPSASIPSRHLGLTLGDNAEMRAAISRAASLVAEGVDIARLLELTRTESSDFPALPASPPCPVRFKVSVAYDDAFSFVYPANLDSLRASGAEITTFSPIAGDPLPPDTDLLYLPGGYPELYLPALSANFRLKEQIRRYAEAGGRVLAECGGLIYLCRDLDGVPMVGLLPMSATMQGARLRLGYRTVSFPDGTVFRGHEFHYSRLTDPCALPSVAVQTDARGLETDTPVYRYKNVIAGYTHLYWGNSDILSLWK